MENVNKTLLKTGMEKTVRESPAKKDVAERDTNITYV